MARFGWSRSGHTLIVLAIAVAVAFHGFGLYCASGRLALPPAALAGAAVLITLKHGGLLAPLYARLKRRFRPTR